MEQFRITFEDVGFTDDTNLGSVALNDAAIASFNASASRNKRFPSRVLKLLSAHVAEDDAQGKRDIKIFVSIDLLVESKSEDTADSFAPPGMFLEKIQALLFQSATKSVDMQGNWETTMAIPEENRLSLQA